MANIEIYLTPEGGTKFQFPMLPEKIQIGCDANFVSYDIIGQGKVKIPRGENPEEYSWSGKFPGTERESASYVQNYTPAETLIQKCEKYRDDGTKCQLLVSGTGINADVYISSFKGKYNGMDFDYDIKFIEAPDIKIYKTSELKKKSSTKKRTSSKKSKKSTTTKKKATTTTYTVVKNDTLWKIAQKKLGNGKRWTEIYKLNKAKIKNPDLIYIGQKFTIPAK